MVAFPIGNFITDVAVFMCYKQIRIHFNWFILDWIELVLVKQCAYHFGKWSSLHGHWPMSSAIFRKMCFLSVAVWSAYLSYKRFGILLVNNRSNAFISSVSSFPRQHQTTRYSLPKYRMSANIALFMSTDTLFLLYSANEITTWDQQ